MKLHLQTLFVAIGLGIKRNWHIFLAIIAGIILGNYIHNNPDSFNSVEELLDFTGQAFLRIIKMVVIPLVCSAIIVGISSIGDSKQIGKFGKKMIIYYGIITIAAVSIGAVLASAFQPGIGAKSHIESTITPKKDKESSIFKKQLQKVIKTDEKKIIAKYDETFNDEQVSQKEDINKNEITTNVQSTGSIFLDMIPQNPLESLARGEMIPIIFFALIFSLALAKVGEINRPIVALFESVFAATMKITDWIMILAAPGIFALTASSVAKYGIGMFGAISELLGVIFLGFLIQFFVVYPLILKIFSKVPVSTFYIAIIEALLVAFGTASSSATLPLTIACCEKRGISHKVCSFVLPLGATLNMDGTALFQVVCVLFLMQAYGLPYDLSNIFLIMVLAIISSSTSAGIPGGGLITLAIILSKFGLDPEMLVVGFGFLFTIERLADMLRTTVNVASDAVVAAVIADNENEIDYDLLNNTEQYKEII